jgi:hypothetical protein
MVTAHFVSDSESATGRAPFGAMRQDSPASGAELREKMREFVPKCAIDLGVAMFAQSRIQRNEFGAGVGASGAGFQTRVPFHLDQK